MFKRKLDVHYIDNTQAPTRQHDAVKVKDIRVNFTTVEKSVYCKGAREWNGLCVADRNIQDFKKFKEKQKKMDDVYDSVDVVVDYSPNAILTDRLCI